MAVILIAATLSCCYRGPTPAMGGNTVTKKSIVPCLESCGGNVHCKGQCQPLGDLPPPPGNMYQR